LGETIAAIRAIPGLEDFRAGPQWVDIAAAVDRKWPLVYINPTPQGTVLLFLYEEDGTVAARAIFVDVTSTEVTRHIYVSGGDFEIGLAERRGSYLSATLGRGRDLSQLLEELLGWLGPRIILPLADLLDSIGATAATLVLCGPLDGVPLHAAPLDSSKGVLGDQFELRYAPSAMACAIALARAERSSRMPRHLVAVADPSGNLPASRAEVEEISALFGGEASTWRAGAAATLEFLQQHAGQASHLHLACHARGGVHDASEAELALASGPQKATELTSAVGLNTRLVTVSSCQSAQATMGNMLNAEFSIAMAFLAAGSACVIASLWLVDDLATALLMTRLYQELLVGENTPPQALRVAQLWLRDLSDDEEQRFLDRHPQLAEEYARRVALGDPPGRPGKEFAGAPPGTGRRYALPEFWAPFIAVGV